MRTEKLGSKWGRGGARHEHGSASMEARGEAGGQWEVEDEDQEER